MASDSAVAEGEAPTHQQQPATAASAEVDGTEPGTEASTRSRPRDRVLLASLALILLPLAVSGLTVIVGVGGGFMPIGDFAQMELRVRDVGAHTPLVGLWSREDWNHPGPLGFYVLAPVYRLIGSRYIGLNLSALLVNGVALSAIALVARRRGGTPLMLCTLVISGLMVTNLGADFVRSPWNVYLPLLSFGLLILLAWSMACGEAWALPVAVGVLSFAAQTHVGFVAYGGPLVAWGLAALVGPVLLRRLTQGEDEARETGDGPQRRPLLRAGLWSAGLVAVLWLPPLLDHLTNDQSNATAIVDFFTDPSEAHHSLMDGWRVMAAQFSLDAEWLTGRQAEESLFMGETSFMWTSPLPVLLLPVAGAAGVLCWWGKPGDRSLVATLVVAYVTVLVAVSRTLGPMLNYRLAPTWWVAALGGAMVLWVGWRAGSARWPAVERRGLLPLAGLALVVLAVVNSVAAVRNEIQHTADSEMMAGLTSDVVEAVGESDREGEVLVLEGSSFWTFYAEAIVLQLERRGIDVSVPPGPVAELRYGSHRVHEPDAPVRATLVVAYDESIDGVAMDPRYRPVAEWTAEEDPRDATDRPIANHVVVFMER